MKIKYQNNELRKFSLEELKSMPKSEVIWLDIIQFPLHEKTLNYFKNLYKKNEQILKRNMGRLESEKRYPVSYKLFYFLSNPFVLTTIYKKDYVPKKVVSRPVDIKNLIDGLGMKAGKLETFIDVQTEEGKNLLLSLKIKDYWTTAFIDSTRLFILKDLEDFSFAELLNSKTLNREDLHYFNHHKTILRIRDFFIAFGFKLGEYPFLNEEFWNQIEKEQNAKKKKQNLQQTLFALKQIAEDSGLSVDYYPFLQTDFWKKEIDNKK